MAIVGMNHFTVLSSNLERTKAFYIELLGLTEGWRPDLGFPGAWLYCGDHAVLHVIAGRALPADAKGVIDHMAFTGKDLSATVGKLQAAGIQYDLRKQRGNDLWQLFCFDPDGARVELDFEGSEPAP
jgi:catechol 2,3-dioxygenase-like lactoylglutathione lyase family enzyme